MTPIGFFIEMFAIYICAILIHEVGHIMAFRAMGHTVQMVFTKRKMQILGKDTKIPFYGIQTGEPSDYIGLTKLQYYNITIAGIAAGFIPILLDAVLNNYYVLWLVIPYIYGINKDMKILYKLYRGQPNLETY